jgi:hypothetical protein
MSPAKGEKRVQKTREEKNKRQRNLIRWLHVISTCQIHTLRCSLSCSLQNSPTLPNQTIRLYFGFTYFGGKPKQQSYRNLETWIFVDNPYGRMSTYQTLLQGSPYVSAHRKVRRKKLGSDLRKRNSNN